MRLARAHLEDENARTDLAPHLRRAVVRHALRLLVHTDRSAGQGARTLSSSSPTNFGEFFLRETGETPAGSRTRA